LLPLAVGWRLRDTPDLARLSPADLDATRRSAERVSIVLPARDEAVHIDACVRAIRATTWPDWELLVVDDHSADGTGDLARAAAEGDPRVRVLAAPALPDGWFGKQWACQTGADAATGELLLFTDADTRHHPELLVRAVTAMRARGAALFSVGGRQDTGSFWEHAIQPVVFLFILARYGGARTMERARTPEDVVANGQCFLVSRADYERLGRHEAVRGTVAEDLMIAQRAQAAGLRVSLGIGREHLGTRMYDGLASVVKGWRKNVYAGGRLAMKWGRAGRFLFPFLLVGFPLFLAAPFGALALAALAPALRPVLLPWAGIAAAPMLLLFGATVWAGRAPLWRVLYAPIGAVAFAAICVDAIRRGQQVEWKGRRYRSA
jgi:chlorobactene glucosyltransferase